MSEEEGGRCLGVLVLMLLVEAFELLIALVLLATTTTPH